MLYIQSVIIQGVGLYEARKKARKILDKRILGYEVEEGLLFRNIPRNRFISETLRRVPCPSDWGLSGVLIVGELKAEE